MSSASEGQPSRQLTLIDAISIVVGIIIGAGIFETTPLIAGQCANLGQLAAVWTAGGLVALMGALCFAELATMYPRAGGVYVYLTEAFGPVVGNLFAWCEFWLVRPGSIGAMAFIFARYAAELLPAGWGDSSWAHVSLAGGCVVFFSLTNMLGVRSGKSVQNALTAAKVLGLALIAAAALLGGGPESTATPAPQRGGALELALILVFFTYGGWNEVAYAAAEVRRPEVNLTRSLLFGSIAVWLIYLAMVLAFVFALGLGGVAASKAVAVDAVGRLLGPTGGRFVAVLVCVSCLGAINGMVLTGSRIPYALGAGHPMFGWLGAWSRRWDAPLSSLALQGVVTTALVALVANEHGFERLVMFTAPVFWTFMLLVAAALFVLRFQQPTLVRPYRVAGYPFTPLAFLGACLCVVYSSGNYLASQRPPEAIWGGLMVGVGLIFALATGVRWSRPNNAAVS